MDLESWSPLSLGVTVKLPGQCEDPGGHALGIRSLGSTHRHGQWPVLGVPAWLSPYHPISEPTTRSS